MAKCAICEKGPHFGNAVSHSHRRSNKVWNANVKSVKVKVNGNAKKMYVCNIMSEHGETDNYKVSDCIKKINSYVKEDLMDAVVVNNKKVPDGIKERYLGEIAGQIDIDYDVLNDMNVEIIEDELLYISEKKKVRHDPYRTALAIFNYIVKELK